MVWQISRKIAKNYMDWLVSSGVPFLREDPIDVSDVEQVTIDFGKEGGIDANDNPSRTKNRLSGNSPFQPHILHRQEYLTT